MGMMLTEVSPKLLKHGTFVRIELPPGGQALGRIDGFPYTRDGSEDLHKRVLGMLTTRRPAIYLPQKYARIRLMKLGYVFPRGENVFELYLDDERITLV